MSILVIGSANTDLIIQVDMLPKPGQTILGKNFNTASGGKGANQAMAVARLGGKVTFLASIGQDAFGDALIKNYNDAAIDATLIGRPSCPSGIAMIYVAKNAENTIAVAPESNGLLSAQHICNASVHFQSNKFVLTQLEIPIETVLESAKIAKEKHTRFILNPAPAQNLPAEIFPLIDTITPNQTEAKMLTGIDVVDEKSATHAARILHKTGVKNVIITLGRQGALLYNNDSIKIIPGYPVKAIDTTAAGDTFNGALVYALDKDKAMIEAIVFANKAAALSVTTFGAQPSIPTLKSVEAFKQVKSLLKC